MFTINKLIEGFNQYKLRGNPEETVTGISYDSRKVRQGNIFFCIQGQRTTGINYVNEAVNNGARIIIADNDIPLPQGVTLIIVPDVVESMALLSVRFYDNPSSKLLLVGITGTNGKTTTTYILESIFNQSKMPTSVIGTINYRFGKEMFPAINTTPVSADLQYLLSEAVRKDFKCAVMEVSSHALAMNRMVGCEFDVGIFTNLTRDHLDYHKDMDNYLEAKLKLFQMLNQPGQKQNRKFAIINNDSLWAGRIKESISSGRVNVITYGIDTKSDINVTNLKINSKESAFILQSKSGEIRISTSLVGRYNVYNILASCACAISQGIDAKHIIKGVELLTQVPGRLEKVSNGQPFTVLVDYAHTDDALQNVLSAVKGLHPRRVITVFGCGGDRDRSKRPLMGEVATELSDWVIVTSDNPRTEDPGKIVLDIEVGIRRNNRNNYEIIIDRKEAIHKALDMAGEKDIVLLAGKGHETYQVIGDTKIPFDDRDIARKYLRNKSSS